jgi:hypothetical protein
MVVVVVVVMVGSGRRRGRISKEGYDERILKKKGC